MRSWLVASALLLAAPADPGHHGVISGVVTHSKTEEPLPGALVILQCSCLRSSRETQTNAEGFYAFRGLPAGTYTVQVLAGQADVSKVLTLPETKPESSPEQRP